MSDKAELGELESWVGREERASDVLTPRLVGGFRATLDHDEIAAEPGEPAPQGIHWLLAPPTVRARDLGPDAHPRLGLEGGIIPPIPLPRRMWAGSTTRFLRPLRIGETVERHSRIASIVPKEGRSGPLVFVEVAHAWSVEGATAVEESQTIVYRDPGSDGPRPAAPSKPPEANWTWRREVLPDPPLLFRYSALTFNGHRIHYDLAYATGVEGYAGLVVHGPLWATLLMDLCARELGDQPLKNFSFRARSPAFAGRPATLAGRPEEGRLVLAALGEDGRAVVTAEALPA